MIRALFISSYACRPEFYSEIHSEIHSEICSEIHSEICSEICSEIYIEILQVKKRLHAANCSRQAPPVNSKTHSLQRS